jgi:hypothetical protein
MKIIVKAEATHFVDTWDMVVGRSAAVPYVIFTLEVGTGHKWSPIASDTVDSFVIIPIVFVNGPPSNRLLAENNVGVRLSRLSLFVQ